METQNLLRHPILPAPIVRRRYSRMQYAKQQAYRHESEVITPGVEKLQQQPKRQSYDRHRQPEYPPDHRPNPNFQHPLPHPRIRFVPRAAYATGSSPAIEEFGEENE